MSKHALIVGASRGLGLGLVETFLGRGWSVTATQRSASTGLAALACSALHVETVDIDDEASVASLHARIVGDRYDLVFVVAGISNGSTTPLPETPRATATQIFQTNSVSPILFGEKFLDTLKPGGTMAFMTSILGSVSLNTKGGWEVYRASKAALNTLARSFQLRHAEVDAVLMHPGWVRTDMGGPTATLDIETSVTGMTDVLEQERTPGCIYVDYTGATLGW